MCLVSTSTGPHRRPQLSPKKIEKQKEKKEERCAPLTDDKMWEIKAVTCTASTI